MLDVRAPWMAWLLPLFACCSLLVACWGLLRGLCEGLDAIFGCVVVLDSLVVGYGSGNSSEDLIW